MAASAVLPFKVRRNARSLRAVHSAERERQAGFKRVIDRVDLVIAKYEARAAHFDIFIKELQARKKHALARAAAVEEATLEFMTDAGLDKLTGNHATLTKRANGLSLVVDDLRLVPTNYRRTKTSTEADKVAIKVALDRGEEVAGVHLTQSVSLIRSK